MTMLDKSRICERYIRLLGRTITVLRKDGSEDRAFAVIQDYWKKRKSFYDKRHYPAGEFEPEYYYYIGTAGYDITQLRGDEIVICDGKKMCFVKADAMRIGDAVQYYYGTLKRVWEDEYDFR